MSTVVPPSWIIEEKNRRDNERRRRESERNELPISHPDHSDELPEYDPEQDEGSKKKETVIIIDI